MEAILFIGIQATGKSSFFKERFADTHVRINLDMLRTRHRERRFLQVCCETQTPFVSDNTNPTRSVRAGTIAMAKAAQMEVIGYYFQSSVEAALARNASRSALQRVPDVGVRGTHAKLELPAYAEGFDQLFYVQVTPPTFSLQEWNDEV